MVLAVAAFIRFRLLKPGKKKRKRNDKKRTRRRRYTSRCETLWKKGQKFGTATTEVTKEVALGTGDTLALKVSVRTAQNASCRGSSTGRRVQGDKKKGTPRGG